MQKSHSQINVSNFFLRFRKKMKTAEIAAFYAAFLK